VLRANKGQGPIEDILCWVQTLKLIGHCVGFFFFWDLHTPRICVLRANK
jgi:hypothetical protein